MRRLGILGAAFERRWSTRRRRSGRVVEDHPAKYNLPGKCHEFSGTPAVDNWYVRSLAGPAVYRKPLDAVNRDDFLEAFRVLQSADIVLPMANLSALPRLLGTEALPLVREVTSGHHSTLSDRQFDPKLLRLLRERNHLDIELYNAAERMFSQKHRRAVQRAAAAGERLYGAEAMEAMSMAGEATSTTSKEAAA